MTRQMADGNPFVGAARLVCQGCGCTRQLHSRGQETAGPVDPFFRLPLWLQAACRGETLWAYNAEHLAVLTGYVGAGLRERTAAPSAYTMVEILPRWMKLARHRGEVLRILDRLHQSLPE
ncbi:hypothetical protein J2X68_000866 [Streptomyces sp. 3330]|uniref:hypothetical protein n=1 Tax=Streptomyces sp. 3330 TaxID=2817755 RepID=UPI00285D084C|nr:hypothetical protein [Streptomyces sp. 3330]MDR6974188.1 hypothetical protein [Streptomyces sp. 3330]